MSAKNIHVSWFFQVEVDSLRFDSASAFQNYRRSLFTWEPKNSPICKKSINTKSKFLEKKSEEHLQKASKHFYGVSSSSCCSEDKVGMRKVKTKLGEFGKKWRLLCFEVFDQYCVVQSVMLKCKDDGEMIFCDKEHCNVYTWFDLCG